MSEILLRVRQGLCARRWLQSLFAAGTLFLGTMPPASGVDGFSSIAFYYGESPPVSMLKGFDVAVVEPDSGFRPPADGGRTRWLAYVSMGEVEPSRAYRKDMPPAWIIGRNTTWGAEIIDQTARGWPRFLVTRILAPLQQAGYQGFFLDTLDSYHLLQRDKAALARQRDALAGVILRIRRAYPQAMIIMNRGFELLPRVHAAVNAVAFESLFEAWDQDSGRYGRVARDEREWLLDRADAVRSWGLPAISIDYCPPDDAACIRRTVARIRALGIIPYVGDGHLQTVSPLLLPARQGPGATEAAPGSPQDAQGSKR